MLLWYAFDDAVVCCCLSMLIAVYVFVIGDVWSCLLGYVCGVWLFLVVVIVGWLFVVVCFLLVVCCLLVAG